MKRKLLSLWLALVMLLAQMPFAHAASIEEMSTKVTIRDQTVTDADSGTHKISSEFRTGITDYSQYLTDNIISKEELTIGGTPFYELSIEEAIDKIPSDILSMENIILDSKIDKDFTGNAAVRIAGNDEMKIFGGTSVDENNVKSATLTAATENGAHLCNLLFLQQEEGYPTLYGVNYMGGYLSPADGKTASQLKVIALNTGVRGISSADSIETILNKLGVSIEGSKKIAVTLQESNRYFNLTTGKLYDINAGGEFLSAYPYNEYGFAQRTTENDNGHSYIFYHDDDIRFQMNLYEGRLSYWRIWKGGPLAHHRIGTDEVSEYIYDSVEPGEDTKLPTELLDRVTDSQSAADAVKQMTDGMTNEQKASSTGADLATLYAETAVSKAASKAVDGDVIISAAFVSDVEAAAKQAASAVETALVNGGVTTARYLTKTVALTTDETGEITIKIDPDILTTEVDKIRVETPSYALTLKTADLVEDLTEVLTITAEEVGSGFAPGKVNRKVTVKVTLPKGRTTNPVTISLPADKGVVTYQAVVKTDGSATSSKYNPATTTMDGKVNTSGTYTVQMNEKSFTDISNKSAEMQKAILYLTSKGIINGTSATTFSPNGTINRQQVAALLMRALGKVDNSAVASFKDVSTQSSLYHEIASSKKHKIVNGYSDNTFRGTNVISRAQIVTVAGRVLTSEMNYKAPSNSSTYLAKYSDTVPDFAKEMVALATRENLVVYRTDGTFSGAKNMTRGDAAIILYRLFQKIW